MSFGTAGSPRAPSAVRPTAKSGGERPLAQRRKADIGRRRPARAPPEQRPSPRRHISAPFVTIRSFYRPFLIVEFGRIPAWCRSGLAYA